MKKIIFLFVSIVFLAVAAQAQSQSSNTVNTQTQEIQKISPQPNGTVTTEQSTVKANCNPPMCKKGNGCCQNKMSKSNDNPTGQTLNGEVKKSNSSTTPVESKLQSASKIETVKEEPAPKK